ncbi:MAG: hypothetical protein R2800_07990 [Flavipsychrobacter sp.]
MNNIIDLGLVPVCKEAVVIPITADETGTWAFMTAFNGAYQYVQFQVEAGNTIVVPVRLNEDYTYVFKLYKPDNSVFNDNKYSIKTTPLLPDVNYSYFVPEGTGQIVTGRKQFVATDGQDMVSHLDLVNAIQIVVFVEGAIIQTGNGDEEYLFDNVTGIVSWNQPLIEGQKITILYFK